MNFRLKDSFYFIAVQPHDANVTISMGIKKNHFLLDILLSPYYSNFPQREKGRKGERS